MPGKKYIVWLVRQDDRQPIVVRAENPEKAKEKVRNAAVAWGYTIDEVVELDEWMAEKRSA